ncbi:hypothetical protein L1987_32654 [Smallanthus sonchifolius]|uniref:Uncharacterized protein n=1 Tax=Smallanthus sonchifolius TaxID=185202 RepID=A0ACB9HPP3_9ASTR|nr:hypothetical protein L1987_32654 [Smallanthus sonchifolius]
MDSKERFIVAFLDGVGPLGIIQLDTVTPKGINTHGFSTGQLVPLLELGCHRRNSPHNIDSDVNISYWHAGDWPLIKVEDVDEFTPDFIHRNGNILRHLKTQQERERRLQNVQTNYPIRGRS